MRIEAYAKVNFTLEVLGKRADGYHALRSLVVPVCLTDTLTLVDAEDISSDTGYDDDLCVKAAKILKVNASEPKAIKGVAISVEKRIPAGGGLGGGSADAAATLVALNEMWGLKFTPERLAEIGAEVGSDVPSLVLSRFFGPVIMEGRGELVRPAGGDFPRLNLVLVNPGVFSSTPRVFAGCNSRVTDDPKILYNIISSYQSCDLSSMAASFMNDLETAAMELNPEIKTTKEALIACGVSGALMSGSGSTVFGLVSSEDEGRKIASSLRAGGYSAWCVKTYCPVV
jgi:4-diphosphocytidyl-2-C-methyl-D-erythritol kinase